MILTIHDNNLQKVAFIDNNKQGTLNFYNDKWTRYLSKASSLFEFTVFKQTIQTDIVPYQTANALNDRSFVSFVYKGRTYLFNVMTIEETEHTITCTCKDLNLELTNEYTNPFKSNKARTFKEYCDVMGLLEFATLRIGVNEISDQKRTLGWEGQDTKLNRILSLANKFDAEVDFEVKLNANGTIKDFILNVYREHDDKHQGVGKVRSDIILKKGENIRSIKRKIDKTDLIVNAVRPTAQGENGQEITIAGLGPWEVKNENGVVEFFQQGEMLYAPISMQKYPSVWTGSTGNRDKYTRKDITVDTKSKEMLRTQAYKELMRSAYPSVTYEIDGYVDLEIGDTAKVYNGDFYPALLLEVRVSEQTISFTKPSTNKTVFDNVRALKNKLSNGIQERWQELFEASQPYLIKLATDNGVIFKNGAGQSIVTPILYKGGRPITANVTWRWSLDGAVKTGMTYSVRGADVTDTSTLTVAAYIGNDEVAVDELTFVNVLDGRDGGVGPKGDPGNDGVAGRDGNKVYTSIYEMSANQSGIYLSDLTPTANPANLPPIGSIVIAPSGKMYPIIALNPTSTPPSYTAGALVGNIKGPQGDNGQTPVVHWAYSDNADGTGLTISDNGQRYIGHYSDYTQADSTDKTKYRWADRWAKIEVGGRNYLRNSSFVDGVSYWQNNSGAEQFSWRSVPEFATQLGRKGCVHLYSNGLPLDALGIFQVIQDMQLSEQEKITLSFDVVGREGNDSGLMVIINNHLFDVRQIIPVSSIRTYSQFTKTSLERKALTFTIPKACDAINVIIIFHGGITGDVVLTDFMLERGLVATSHQESPSDIADRIGVKADQALTQEQLNLLNERAGIIQAELEAKASLDTVNNILKQIKDMKAADEATWAKVEKDLITHLQRVIKIETNLGDQAQRWNAVDTFMQVSNEGLSLGKADGSSSMLFSPDGRITMFSSGTPVMYVDKGVIHIDNGIFSKTVQIGLFREEQYHNNPYINVKRCVG
ncbi:phage tail spike protein [Streptococcus suis]